MGSQFDSLANILMPALFKVLVITVQVDMVLRSPGNRLGALFDSYVCCQRMH